MCAYVNCLPEWKLQCLPTSFFHPPNSHFRVYDAMRPLSSLAFHFDRAPSHLNELKRHCEPFALCGMRNRGERTSRLFFNFGDVLTAEWFLQFQTFTFTYADFPGSVESFRRSSLYGGSSLLAAQYGCVWSNAQNLILTFKLEFDEDVNLFFTRYFPSINTHLRQFYR